MKTKILVSVCALLAACTAAEDGNRIETVSAEANSLGITQLEIEHQDLRGERILLVRGLDANNNEIASARLLVGMVPYEMDGDSSGGLSPGTELVLTAGTETMTITAPDRLAHSVTQPDVASLATFVRLTAVATEIRHEAGISFTEKVSPTEVALTPTFCDSSLFPTNKADAVACCAETGSATSPTYHVIGYDSASPTSYGKIAYRNYYLLPCRQSNGSTGCTNPANATPQVPACYYGPCQAANVWTKGKGWGFGGNYDVGRIFYPSSPNTNHCGWDSVNDGAWPAAYNGEEMYPINQPSCPYTGCNTDGTPY